MSTKYAFSTCRNDVLQLLFAFLLLFSGFNFANHKRIFSSNVRSSNGIYVCASVLARANATGPPLNGSRERWISADPLARTANFSRAAGNRDTSLFPFSLSQPLSIAARKSHDRPSHRQNWKSFQFCCGNRVSSVNI